MGCVAHGVSPIRGLRRPRPVMVWIAMCSSSPRRIGVGGHRCPPNEALLSCIYTRLGCVGTMGNQQHDPCCAIAWERDTPSRPLDIQYHAQSNASTFCNRCPCASYAPWSSYGRSSLLSKPSFSAGYAVSFQSWSRRAISFRTFLSMRWISGWQCLVMIRLWALSHLIFAFSSCGQWPIFSMTSFLSLS